MVNKLISLAIFAFLAAVSVTQLSAQSEQKTKIVILEKEIDDDGNVSEKRVVLEGEEAEKYLKENKEAQKWITKEGENIDLQGQKSMMIKRQAYKFKVKDGNGMEKELEWDGEGEMPEEMKKLMEREGIEQHNLDLDMDIEMERDMEKKMRIMAIDSKDGKTIEWDGEGEMPEELRALLEKEGVDIEKLVEDALQEEGEEMEQTITFDDNGKTKKLLIKKKGAGLEDVMDLDWEGDELPEEVSEILMQEGIDLEEIIGEDGSRQIKITQSATPSKEKKSKPQLGVMIDNAATGVAVSEIVEESSAAVAGILAGDIITSVEGKPMANTDDLIAAIKGFQVGDKIKVGLTRSGRPFTKEVTLKAYQDPYPFKTWEQVMKKGDNEVIKKKIIIKEK